MVSNMISYCLGILWFIIIMKDDIESDYEKWKNNIPLNHITEGFKRALMLIPAMLFLSLPKIEGHNFIWVMTTAALMMAAIWWEFFDGILNTIKGFSWRFNGSKDEKDNSILDEFLRKIPPKLQAILKWGLIIIFTFLYLKS